MTTDEINALPLDQLRLEIAKALGWKQVGHYEGGIAGTPIEGERLRLLPDWPTSAADAVTLLDDATKRGWMYQITGDESGVMVSMYLMGSKDIVNTPTFAEAVSRAWLAAFHAEKGGSGGVAV